MRKLLLLTTFILLTLPSKASHSMGAYFEYKVDSVRQELELRLHVILDSAGIPMIQNIFFVYGPVNITLNSTGAPAVYYKIGGVNCSGKTYYEKVFVGTLSLKNPAMQTVGRKNFAADFPCCFTLSANVFSTSHYLEFSIWPRQLPNDTIYYPEFNNIGRNPAMVQSAYPDIRNYLDFGLTSMPLGTDSVYHKLLNVQSGANTSMPYRTGFSGTNPLPDKSEDSLNGDNIYLPQQRIISARARAGSYNSGLYSLRFRNQYFRSGVPYIVEDCMPIVYYFDRDTNYTDTLMSRVERNGNLLSNTAPAHTINVNASYGENIQLDLSAFAGLGDSIYIISENLNIDTSSFVLPAGTAFALPSLQSLNPGQSFNALDTNKLLWTFQAQLANFFFGPKQYKYKLILSNARCDGFVSVIRVQINLEDQAFIYSLGDSTDSLVYCENLRPALGIINGSTNSYWSPGNWVQDSNAVQTTLASNNLGWLYLRRGNGLVQDSIYILPELPGSNKALQAGTAESIFHNAATTNATQVWEVSNLIKVKPLQNNTLPILGSGSYSFVNDLGVNRCKEYSDTFSIAEDFLWSSNFGADTLYTNGVQEDTSGNDRYAVKLSMPNDARYISKIFYYGFKNPEPNQIKTLKLKVSTSSGYQDSVIYTINSQEYVEFPVNFDLGPGLQAELEVVLDSGLIYQNLSNSQQAFTRNFIGFSDMRMGPVGGNLATSNYRLPLGFRYRGQVGLNETSKPAYEFFPNPAHDKAFLNWDAREEAQLNVYSVTGELERSYTVQKGPNVLDLQLKPGMYYLNFPAYPQVESRVLMVK
jgi:hypothetical protein